MAAMSHVAPGERREAVGQSVGAQADPAQRERPHQQRVARDVGQERGEAPRADPVALAPRDITHASTQIRADPILSRRMMPDCRSRIDATATAELLPFERPLGGRPLGAGRAEFRVWAPRAQTVSLVLGEREVELSDAGFGVYETVADAHAGEDYWYELDGQRLPDPCSRWQPEGLRGSSRLVEVAQRRHSPRRRCVSR